MQRGDVWWANLPSPVVSSAGYRRPVLLVQADAFTMSRLATVIAVVLSSNLRLVTAPGNVLLRAPETGLPRDSVANVSQVITLNKVTLDQYAGHLSGRTLEAVERGIRLVLDL